MEIIANSTQRIMLAILKYISGPMTISMLEDVLKMSHVGIWKAIKKLESSKMITLKTAGNKKNSTYFIHLNWENPLVEKTLSLMLAHEVTNQRRWIVNFAEIENKVDFLILYGSILVNPQKANDIDLISIVSKKNIAMDIEKAIMKVQKTQVKPIHNIIFAPANLKYELKKPNVAFVSAIRDGVVLFGHDNFVKFIKELENGQ
jgi:hypothetical protein